MFVGYRTVAALPIPPEVLNTNGVNDPFSTSHTVVCISMALLALVVCVACSHWKILTGRAVYSCADRVLYRAMCVNVFRGRFYGRRVYPTNTTFVE